MTLRISSWSGEELAEAISGTWHGAPASVLAVETDSRKPLEGALFVALEGERFDGHDFVAGAAARGARAALVSRQVDVDLPQIVVEDTLVALQSLGHAVWKQATSEGLHTVALTGSNGKTTTKEFLAALFRTLGPTHHTPGNFNNHIGVPLTLCGLPAQAEFAVVEMGCNDFGDIRELIAMAPGRQRVLVSIGAAHLENLGDLDGVRRVKSEIFEHSLPEDIAVIPVAHRAGLHMEPFEGREFLVGEGGDATYSVGEFGAVTVSWSGDEVTVRCPYPGAHNAANLALAVSTLVSGGFEVDRVAVAAELDALVLPGGRLRRVEVGELLIVDDAYNANPTSAVASYDAFLEIADIELSVAPSDRVVVLGEMFELGAEAERMHAETASAMAARGGAETYVWVGPYARAMADAARRANENATHHVAASVEDAAAKMPSRGLVFLKASRGQRLERIIDLVGTA